MSGRRLAGIAAAVGLLAASLLLALLAADVLRADRALEQGDARFGPVAGRGGMWEADTRASRRPDASACSASTTTSSTGQPSSASASRGPVSRFSSSRS